MNRQGYFTQLRKIIIWIKSLCSFHIYRADVIKSCQTAGFLVLSVCVCVYLHVCVWLMGTWLEGSPNSGSRPVLPDMLVWVAGPHGQFTSHLWSPNETMTDTSSQELPVSPPLLSTHTIPHSVPFTLLESGVFHDNRFLVNTAPSRDVWMMRFSRHTDTWCGTEHTHTPTAMAHVLNGFHYLPQNTLTMPQGYVQ